MAAGATTVPAVPFFSDAVGAGRAATKLRFAGTFTR
jgi:hypothetical protein